MATTGTYTFNPDFGNLTQQAFRRCGIARTALDRDHMVDALAEANLMLVEWANKGVNLWKVEPIDVALVAGTATYSMDPSTVEMLDVYVSTPQANGTYIDRQLTSVSRSEYAAYPNKAVEAPPTSFWFNKLVEPTLTLYPVPDDGAAYRLRGYRLVRMQDNALGGATVDVQYLWLEAFVAGLAARLAVMYAPDRAVMLDAKAAQQWGVAAEQNVEDAAFYVAPALGRYYR